MQAFVAQNVESTYRPGSDEILEETTSPSEFEGQYRPAFAQLDAVCTADDSTMQQFILATAPEAHVSPGDDCEDMPLICEGILIDVKDDLLVETSTLDDVVINGDGDESIVCDRIQKDEAPFRPVVYQVRSKLIILMLAC